ncbi:rab-GTPase-TBC domain-containing protein [Mycena maculata]|uniref:Rab-GTPase-TBC domain-containing protein n=1 Tax=Mycena maculata TaxID=230809 RepID=A0AAD7I209_9AGAR|nr:rab-GTPase-TBC domain-containing protein [Mycena maculata]
MTPMDSKASESLDDWEEYRRMSLTPGGFGHQRTLIWPKVLHAHPQSPADDLDDSESPSHPDERQIRLDTERSFVLYPVDSEIDKDTLQSELHDLLVEIFRKRPKLNYFQGYHDIITVLLLTLPRELQLPCAEQLSLQRVRDSMGSTLEPVLGLLRVMKNLLRVADPEYAELLEQSSPLPYYALPNLLTLFSHDMPTLSLIQHVFDYLLCRPPVFVVYLACAIVLSRKQDVERLQEEGEEGMMHSLLSALPEIVDEDDEDEDSLDEDIKSEEKSLVKEEPLSEEMTFTEMDIPLVKQEQSDLPVASEILQNTSEDHAVLESSVDVLGREVPDVPHALTATLAGPTSETKSEIPLSPSTDGSTEKLECSPELKRRKVTKPKPQVLTDILRMSDALYQAHPPTDPSLQLSSIMGPQSVIFTWSTRLSDMPANDEAECMIQRLDLIVYPEPAVGEQKGTTKRRRKLPKRRVGTGTVGMLVGAGLVLGVAVAVSVYGAKQGGDHTRDWRKLGRWVGGVFSGASDMVIRYRT